MTTARRGLGRICPNPKTRQRGSDDPDSMTGNDPYPPFVIVAANGGFGIAKRPSIDGAANLPIMLYNYRSKTPRA